MSSAKYTIRHARPEDIPEILGLIQELADYEKEPQSVEATEESLRATIAFAGAESEETEPTTPTRPARCFLLFPAGSAVPAGMAIYFFNYSTWRAKGGIYLEDLFVREAQRNKGYGTALLSRLAAEVIVLGGARLEWSVLKWNEPSIQFYEAMGAEARHEWVGMRVDREALVELAGRSK